MAHSMFCIPRCEYWLSSCRINTHPKGVEASAHRAGVHGDLTGGRCTWAGRRWAHSTGSTPGYTRIVKALAFEKTRMFLGNKSATREREILMTAGGIVLD